MTTFGTSAYIKLLAQNPKPRDTVIKNRLSPSKGGYDYHKAMRKIVTEYASGIVDFSTTALRLEAIRKVSERNSAISAAKKFTKWVNGRSISIPKEMAIIAKSPNNIFSVKFTPDFEINLNGTTTRIHLWNTMKPEIRIREAIGVLGLFVPDDEPHSIGILSLRSGELFLPTNATSSRELAKFMALDIERRFARVREAATWDLRRPGEEKRA